MNPYAHRPRYNDEAAKRIELEVAAKLSGLTRLHIQPTVPDCVVDLQCLRPGTNSVAAIIEVKRRNKGLHDHPTMHVSLNKMIRIRREAVRLKARAFFVVRVNEGDFFIEVPEALDKFEVRMGGRSDRGDRFDQEEMIHFNAYEFRPLAELAKLSFDKLPTIQ